MGLGATGFHVAQQLMASDLERIVVTDSNARRRDEMVARLVSTDGDRCIETTGIDDVDVLILALPAGGHGELARRAISAGSHVLSLSDRPEDVAGLLGLSEFARTRERAVVVGAGFAPGLSCLLVRHAAAALDRVDAVSISKAGTGGPACARQHHRALKRSGRDWVDGNWVLRRGGSGRDLAWFPDPIGARDCYRGALAGPTLIHRLFPEASRISERVAATRRDRFTSWLPMLRPPHSDGGTGGLRVEVRGRSEGRVETIVYGVVAPPSVAAGTVAAVGALGLGVGCWSPGTHGYGEVASPFELLQQVRDRGIRIFTHAESEN